MGRLQLKKKDNEPKLSDSELSELRQHDLTYNRASIKNNILPVGPFTRSDFPLLKCEKKNKEFYTRIDMYNIDRYFIDHATRKRTKETLFYPSPSWIKNHNDSKVIDETDYIVRLYNQLKENGLGLHSLPCNKPVKKIQLKRKENNKPKRIQLKKKCKRIKLKRKS